MVSVTGHVVRLEGDIPTNMVLRNQVDSSPGHLPSHQWRYRIDLVDPATDGSTKFIWRAEYRRVSCGGVLLALSW